MSARTASVRLTLALTLGALAGCDDDVPAAAGDATVDGARADAAVDGSVAMANPIVRENMLPGTDRWLITRAAEDHEVEGYASKTSVAQGESFTLHVNVSAAHDVRWEAYRLGWYRGDTARLVAEGASRRVMPQTACPIARDTGLVECAWDAAFTITPDATWTTGEYLLKLVRDDGFEQYATVIVRDDRRVAPLLFQASVNTWQAYNDWGGTGLYANHVEGDVFEGPHAYAVSFDRPYSAEDNGSGQALFWEMRMIRWLEQRGYDVSYVTNVDIDRTPSLLGGRKMFLSVGHDEYWTMAERDHVEAARDGGISLGFFTADTATFHVRYAPSSSGAERRTMICYKVDGAARDPERGTARQTTRFSEPAINRPENALLGVMYAQWTGGARFPMVVRNASHWIYAGTNVAEGDTLASIVGSEYDRLHDNGLTPMGLETIAESPGLAREGVVEASHATVYYPTRSSLVFAAGTLSWALALGRDDMVDRRVQRMTENILARAGVTVATPTTVPPQPAAPSPGTASMVTVLAGDGTAGYRDGEASMARFDNPASVAAGPDGRLYVTDARNHRVRVVAADGRVSTLAGCGPNGAQSSGAYRNGTGAEACFNLPTGVAVGSDGTVYVADTNNQRIRAITAAGEVSTWAGDGSVGRRDGERAQATFSRPRGLAVDSDGALYVADAGNDAIRRITREGVTTVARDLDNVTGVAVGDDGTVYAITGLATLVAVRGGEVTRVAGGRNDFAFDDAVGTDARLNPADGLAFAGGRLVIGDALNHRVRAVDVASRRVSTLVGNGRVGAAVGTGASTRLSVPRGVAAFREGFAVADSGNHRVLYVRP